MKKYYTPQYNFPNSISTSISCKAQQPEKGPLSSPLYCALTLPLKSTKFSNNKWASISNQRYSTPRKNLIFELSCDIIFCLLPLTFRVFIVFLVESPINHCLTQKRNMLTSNLTSCPKFRTPVPFRIWKKAGNLLSLCLAKRCYGSSKIRL